MASGQFERYQSAPRPDGPWLMADRRAVCQHSTRQSIASPKLLGAPSSLYDADDWLDTLMSQTEATMDVSMVEGSAAGAKRKTKHLPDRFLGLTLRLRAKLPSPKRRKTDDCGGSPRTGGDDSVDGESSSLLSPSPSFLPRLFTSGAVACQPGSEDGHEQQTTNPRWRKRTAVLRSAWRGVVGRMWTGPSKGHDDAAAVVALPEYDVLASEEDKLG